MPVPSIPVFQKMTEKEVLTGLLGDSFAIGILTFVLNISFAKLFAKKHKYEINPNQAS